MIFFASFSSDIHALDHTRYHSPRKCAVLANLKKGSMLITYLFVYGDSMILYVCATHNNMPKPPCIGTSPMDLICHIKLNSQHSRIPTPCTMIPQLAMHTMMTMAAVDGMQNPMIHVTGKNLQDPQTRLT